ncbi:hypothetical protein DESPIG_01796 [Desulfovibrio piger ATCC 29098]|uniref:Rieske domain-containing protein n=1 Tax=Desulfovibrio piger ATCC 29098 TaxID=411464 RepID=B6WUN4_9BACT|nr:hypothetical protein DESPIG_01796 [Desulfovibrio piger ATCC 29098]
MVAPIVEGHEGCLPGLSAGLFGRMHQQCQCSRQGQCPCHGWCSGRCRAGKVERRREKSCHVRPPP